MVYFNSQHFQGTRVKDPKAFTLTHQIVDAIDGAKSEILIATTRIKLRPIYEALLRAVRRGVSIRIVVSMDEYKMPFRRQTKVSDCSDIWSANCSEGKNYADLLALEPLLSIRFKFYNLKLNQYLSHQMHSKYLIVDQTRVLTGSFNWSYSAEYRHIENLVFFSGPSYEQTLGQMRHDFERLWNLNREFYESGLHSISTAIQNKTKFSCALKPQVLSLDEIDHLLFIRTSEGVTKRSSTLCQ